MLQMRENPPKYVFLSKICQNSRVLALNEILKKIKKKIFFSRFFQFLVTLGNLWRFGSHFDPKMRKKVKVSTFSIQKNFFKPKNPSRQLVGVN